jgi:CRISPR-associated protein Cmr4
MKVLLYKLHVLTNMHVGSGDMGFSIIDNQVQKDVIKSYPVINSSSLKGALKGYFKSNNVIDDDKIKDIFGDSTQEGYATFFDGNLLSFPVRSNKQPFYRAVCPDIIGDFLKFVKDFSINLEVNLIKNLTDFKEMEVKKGSPIIFDEQKGVILEDYKAENKKYNDLGLSKDKLEIIFGSDIALFHDEDFKQLIEELPVMVRNRLINGISDNLWYEEIVPRESKFYFIILLDTLVSDLAVYINQILLEKPVQIGANSSLGYGYCKIEKMVGDINE